MDKIYSVVLLILTPFIKYIGKLHFPFTRKKITGKFYFKNRDKISIGCILLTKIEGELSNIINPAKIPHAGTYVGDIFNDGIRYVAEAVGKGVVLTDLVTFLTTKDVVVCCQPIFIRSDKKAFEINVQQFALDSQGIPYDYGFGFGADAFYCFEFSAFSLKRPYPELQLKCKEIIKGKKIYDHNTFLDEKFFKIVFDSRFEV